jgi:hypothetical protein
VYEKLKARGGIVGLNEILSGSLDGVIQPNFPWVAAAWAANLGGSALLP